MGAFSPSVEGKIETFVICLIVSKMGYTCNAATDLLILFLLHLTGSALSYNVLGGGVDFFYFVFLYFKPSRDL